MAHPVPQTPQALSKALTEAITRAFARPPADSTEGRLTRIELPAPPMEPLAWLQAQDAAGRYYWASRQGDIEMAGVGEADVLIPSGPQELHGLFAHMQSRLSPRHPSLRYYGGFRFHPGPVKGDRWKAFKEYRFIVPRFELVRRGDAYALACNARIGPNGGNEKTRDRLVAHIDSLCFEPAEGLPALPRVGRRTDTPDYEAWRGLVDQALEACARHDLEKVVLARETSFTGSAPFDPVALLRRLVKHSVHAFEFCFQPVPDRAFIGASPERLYKRRNCYLESEALAGTRPRGASDSEDRRLSTELLDSDKELREHRFVLLSLRDSLARFCTATKIDESPSIVRLRNCQHLRTGIEAILKDPDVDAALIEALHPTPAVGGYPRAQALRWLESVEQFDRGIYGAPVGWVGYDAAEFCVAIRSGLVQADVLTLYAGAGIVPGSAARQEWAEIENKMANFLNVLAR